MRIAILNSIRAYGGGEKWVLRAARGFMNRGHHPTVVCAAGSELQARCAGEGIPLLVVRYPHDLSPAGVMDIARALRKSRSQVAIACNERAVRLAAVATRLPGLKDVPLVYRNGLEGSFKNKAHNRVVAAPRICFYVGNADAVAREFRSFDWIPADRVRVIYNGVDPSPVDRADSTGLREELGAAPDDFLILCAARLVPEKGHDFLLNALPSSERIKLWIAGDGPEAGAIQQRINERGLEGRVRMLGFRTDVPRLLRAADVLCHPSRREGAPNIILEAMVAGLPVVGVDASGTSELVKAGETGLLSAVGDGARLRRNLEALAADPELRARLGAAGRERALRDFTEERSIDQWLRLLQECL